MKLNFVGKLRPGRQRRSCPASATPSSGCQSRWPGRRCLRWLAGRSSAAWMLSLFTETMVCCLCPIFLFITASFNQSQQIMITCQASPNLGCESVPILPKRGECLPRDPPERKKGWTDLVSQTSSNAPLVWLATRQIRQPHSPRGEIQAQPSRCRRQDPPCRRTRR